jgi:hypothetical protein
MPRVAFCGGNLLNIFLYPILDRATIYVERFVENGK